MSKIVKTFPYYKPEKILAEVEKVLNIPRMTYLDLTVHGSVDEIPMITFTVEKYREGEPNGKDEQK